MRRTSEKPLECTPLAGSPSSVSPGLHRARAATRRVRPRRPQSRPGHNGRRHTCRASRPSRRRPARSRTGGTPRRCRRSRHELHRLDGQFTAGESSPGRTAVRHPGRPGRSRTWRPGRCRPGRASPLSMATISLVPTPSVQDTSTGSVNPAAFKSNKRAKAAQTAHYARRAGWPRRAGFIASTKRIAGLDIHAGVAIRHQSGRSFLPARHARNTRLDRVEWRHGKPGARHQPVIGRQPPEAVRVHA